MNKRSGHAGDRCTFLFCSPSILVNKMPAIGYSSLCRPTLPLCCQHCLALQVLWALPELRQRYVDAAATLFKSAPADAASDFATQFAKVRVASLQEGRQGRRIPPILQPQ